MCIRDRDKTNVLVTYSFYEATGNTVTDYEVPDEKDLLLGFPAHKLSVLASFSPAENVFVTPSLTYYGTRHAVTSYDSDYVYEKLDPIILTNISLLFKDMFAKKGLDFSFSVYNIFNEHFDFVEPYLGDYAPMPGPSTEFVFKLTYSF